MVKIRWGVLAAGLPVLAVLIGLGTWQMHRLEWKNGLIEAMAVRQALPPLGIGALRDAAARGEEIRFYPARLSGDWKPQEQLRFQTSTITDPYRNDAYMPLDTAEGRVWVHIGVVGRDARALTPPEDAVGYVRRAERPNRFVPANQPEAGNWFWPDVEAMGGAPLALTSHYIALQPAFDSQSDRFNLDNPRASPALTNRHLGYVITWYGLALTLIGVMVAMHWPRRGEGR